MLVFILQQTTRTVDCPDVASCKDRTETLLSRLREREAATDCAVSLQRINEWMNNILLWRRFGECRGYLWCCLESNILSALSHWGVYVTSLRYSAGKKTTIMSRELRNCNHGNIKQSHECWFLSLMVWSLDQRSVSGVKSFIKSLIYNLKVGQVILYHITCFQRD